MNKRRYERSIAQEDRDSVRLVGKLTSGEPPVEATRTEHENDP